jgi:drug/metabolite transporter (DMT)-like permease
MVCGVALMVYPYFVDNTWLLLGIGAVLCIAPFVIRE